MGFFSGLLSAAGVLALDALSALISGPKPIHAADLKNKTFGSDAYGNPWPRCRGTVRLQGKDIWATKIQTSGRKTVSGGLFGLGSQSVYYNLYSCSLFIGFGKKLGGGAAKAILRIWADGKILYSTAVSGAAQTGTVTVTSGGVAAGSQTIPITLGSGATLNLPATTLIEFSSDPGVDYEIQSSVSLNGAGAVTLSIFPALAVDLVGGETVTIPGLAGPLYDLSSFDPDPHDGSHPHGGYVCPPGGIAFYLGSDTQTADPTITKWLGVGNVPGYRGLVGVCIHDLQLRNYGDHIPQFSAEIAFDTATSLFPLVGPVSLDPTGTVAGVILPSSGPATGIAQNPLTPIPYAFAIVSPSGGPFGVDLYRVNTVNNQVAGSITIQSLSGSPSSVKVDGDGVIYFIAASALNVWDLYAYDSGGLVAHFGPAASVPNEPQLGAPGSGSDNLYVWDTLQSDFGTGVVVKFLVAFAGSLIWFFDRTTLLPFGTPDCTPGATNLYPVVSGYDTKGKPIIVAGSNSTVVSALSVSGGFTFVTSDANGSLWTSSGLNLKKWDCTCNSGAVTSGCGGITSLGLGMQFPSFGYTTISISSLTATGSPRIFYDATDDSILVMGEIHTGKVDCTTGVVTTVGPPVPMSIAVQAPQTDLFGSVIGASSSLGSGNYGRFDAASAAFTTTYGTGNWIIGHNPLGGDYYDQLSDSVWTFVGGSLYRMYLDRGNGLGIGLDLIVASLMNEAGYDPSQYDVTLLTASGLTVGGVEFDRETYKESLARLMQVYLFDCAEIDGKIVFVPRGQIPIMTIPEDDLGALADPSGYEPRVTELIEDEQDTPESVWIRYYDTLKEDQQATQYAKRISAPYGTTLLGGGAKNPTNSRQALDITAPFTDSATPIKQQTDKILADAWAGRFSRKFKGGIKYVRLDPTDVVTLDYKGLLLETRLEECDRGAGFALEFDGKSQDQNAYTSSSVSNSGSGSGTPPTQPPPTTTALSYTVSPLFALSEASPIEVDMLQVRVTWSDGRSVIYSARTGGSGFVTVDPGAGNSQRYYVTIYDKNRVGEVAGTPSLPAYCTISPAAAFLGQPGYIFIGTILITHDGVGVVVTSGGTSNITQAQGFYVNGGGGSSTSVKEDLIDYLLMDAVRRPNFHLQGSGQNSPILKNYTYIDLASNSIAQIKATAGWAADILLFDGTYIYQFITELDDVGHRDWSVNTSYKKLKISHGYPTNHALPIMPRYFTPGQAPVDIDVPAPNPYDRFVACSVIDTIDKGHVTNRTYGPVMMNFDNLGNTPGNLGTIEVMVNERYAGAKARERFYWAKNLGFVKWDAATLISGARITGQYAITNWAVHNQLVAGGGVTPSFGCGYGVGWP